MRKRALESNHGEATARMLPRVVWLMKPSFPRLMRRRKQANCVRLDKLTKPTSNNNLHGEKMPPTSRDAYKSQVGSRNTAFMSRHHARMGFGGHSCLSATHAPVRHPISSLVPSKTRTEPFLWSAIGPWNEEMFIHICQEKCKLEPETTFAVTATCT